MLFKFKSQAASDLIMLETDARRLLQIILGHDPVQGIVLARDLSAAIAALELAVMQDQAQRKVRSAQTQQDNEAENDQAPSLPTVGLTQRASPLLNLLKQSMAHKADVVWGV
jgi:hypothetical protein